MFGVDAIAAPYEDVAGKSDHVARPFPRQGGPSQDRSVCRMSLQLIDNPPPWPNGARCAVCFSFDLDAESLLHLYYPDDSKRRISLSSTLRYGARVAVPR